jgi:hypothetical protein
VLQHFNQGTKAVLQHFNQGTKAVLQHFMGWLRKSHKPSGRVAGVLTLLEYKSTASH